MASIRPPAVAGTFYPGKAAQLSAAVQALLDGAHAVPCNPRAVIVPHAGYVYSGPIAASVYASLQDKRDRIKRIALLGPSHRIRFNGLALPDSDQFETPLGLIPLDADLMQRLRKLPQVCVRSDAHAEEHSLEVQLPFLQKVFADFTLVPLAVGRAAPEEVAGVLRALPSDSESLIVISSDLSHFLDYDSARKTDQATSRAIEELASDRIRSDDACGCHAVNGLLALARESGWNARTLDLRNSGDTAGDKRRVVGYGAYVFE